MQQKGPPEGPISRTPFWPVCTRKRLKTGPKKGPPKGPVLASETGLLGLRMALEWWGPRWPYPLVEWAQSPGTRQEAVLGVSNYPSFGGAKRGSKHPFLTPLLDPQKTPLLRGVLARRGLVSLARSRGSGPGVLKRGAQKDPLLAPPKGPVLTPKRVHPRTTI